MQKTMITEQTSAMNLVDSLLMRIAGYSEQLNDAQRPPLPAGKWVTGIATFAEARRLQRELAERYVVHCGMGVDGFYVAGPNSGLCAVHVPYRGDTGGDFALQFDEVLT